MSDKPVTPTTENPYAGRSWDEMPVSPDDMWAEAFAAGRAAASPDPPCAHGLTGGRGATERCFECGASVPAASPDERLREAAVIEAVAWSLFPDHPRPMSEAGLDCARRAIDTALFAAADREAPDGGR